MEGYIYIFMSLGFTKIKADPKLYFKVMDDELVILLLYVDDLFLTRNVITQKFVKI